MPEGAPGDLISCPSPNVGDRRNGVAPDLVVLHYTAMQSAEAAQDRLCDPAAEVSAHYLIAEDGRTWQLADEARRAWHAGAGSWGGRGDVNSRSIGIELANRGDHPFSEPQMRALERLLQGVMARWDIRPEGIIGHADMAPERKSDPGPRFDWQRLARQGLSVWPEGGQGQGAGGDPARFRADATAFGYPGDVAQDALLQAMRYRFRPWARGPLDGTDLAIMRNLARRFPVDRAGRTA